MRIRNISKSYPSLGHHSFIISRWYSNVSGFATLGKSGPTYEYEYSTREAYGANISWPANAPLNATWWHLVTERKSSNIKYHLQPFLTKSVYRI